MTNQKILRKRPKKEKIDKKVEDICPDCKSTEFEYDYSRGEVTCKCCGYVIDENLIDKGQDWVAYDHEQQNARAHTGAPSTVTRHDNGLSTVIDSSNSNVSSKELVEYYKIRVTERKNKFLTTRDRNLAFALSEISRKCSNLSLPKVIRVSASSIYRKALDKNLIMGRSIEGIAVSSIYIACRQLRIPRTLDEIAVISQARKREISRTSKFVAKELGIDLPIVSPADYIPRFASKLGLSGKTEVKAIEIANESKEKGLTVGKPPNGIAAAALYVAIMLTDEKKSQNQIAEVAGITELTLRNRYKELIKNLDIDIKA